MPALLKLWRFHARAGEPPMSAARTDWIAELALGATAQALFDHALADGLPVTRAVFWPAFLASVMLAVLGEQERRRRAARAETRP